MSTTLDESVAMGREVDAGCARLDESVARTASTGTVNNQFLQETPTPVLFLLFPVLALENILVTWCLSSELRARVTRTQEVAKRERGSGFFEGLTGAELRRSAQPGAACGAPGVWFCLVCWFGAPGASWAPWLPSKNSKQHVG